MEMYLSQITLYAGGSRVPEGWMLCNGATLQVEEYLMLFTMIGTTYGGNGTTQFQIPNLPPVNGVPYIICVTGAMPGQR